MAGSDEGAKADGAMLAIGELADRIGVPTHVLRYWETRFPQLRPLQRSGRRRYYRAEDVALAEHIHHLLYVQGFTVEGARKVLAGGKTTRPQADAPKVSAERAPDMTAAGGIPVEALISLRRRLAAALG
ncbi:MerR family transcriptional regulator [Sphingopyxis sp. DHUNG17]|uniref:MerR family transcriptional regulator n=1 Tax=Sphingopyxis jiangsuensis TaxID=2871171 RepID=UPI00191FD870|nr:MerR family transcriptional regulator [Sphingopyxis lutea]MBL0768013.1 MerR family transcriptional regulator [Sphingopyxis lutea]